MEETVIKKSVPNFKRIKRQEIPCQSPKDRIHNFNEVALGYTKELAELESSRCIQCKKPMCVKGCPVNIDIPGFIKKIGEGDPLEAAKIIKKSNILPAVCGRVCPQEDQCEKLCIIGKRFEPVAIGRLERYAADYAAANGLPSEHKAKEKLSHVKAGKVAVVGSGPAGLACAGDLAKMGYRVTVLEALHKPGGVLVYGIPEFRLPKKIMYREVDELISIGVEFKFNFVIGKIRTVTELLSEDGYDAVFLANGAGLPVFMNIPGENCNGVFSANEFLTRANLLKAYEFPKYGTPIKRGGKIVVVGGGNVAMDAVRTALRLGASPAAIVYRRSREEMPARKEEIDHAEEEGVKFYMLTNPLKIIPDTNGCVKSLMCINMKLGEPDSSGRRRPIPIKGSEFEVEADTVIMAIGSSSNPLVAKTTDGLKVNRWGNIIVRDEDDPRTSKKGVFAGGDIVTGAATVILAMGAGRNAARSIDSYIRNNKEEW